jgi:hypothetical protein
MAAEGRPPFVPARHGRRAERKIIPDSRISTPDAHPVGEQGDLGAGDTSRTICCMTSVGLERAENARFWELQRRKHKPSPLEEARDRAC